MEHCYFSHWKVGSNGPFVHIIHINLVTSHFVLDTTWEAIKFSMHWPTPPAINHFLEELLHQKLPLECCFKLYWVVFMGFWRGQNSSRMWKISKFFGARFPDWTLNSVKDGNWISGGVVTIMFTSSFGVLVLLKCRELA